MQNSFSHARGFLLFALYALASFGQLFGDQVSLDQMRCRHHHHHKKCALTYGGFTSFFPNEPTTITIPFGGLISFNQVNLNEGIGVNGDFTQFTISKKGWYNITYGVATSILDQDLLIPRRFTLYVNGVAVRGGQNGITSQNKLSLDDVNLALEVGDVIEVRNTSSVGGTQYTIEWKGQSLEGNPFVSGCLLIQQLR